MRLSSKQKIAGLIPANGKALLKNGAIFLLIEKQLSMLKSLMKWPSL